MGEMIDLSGIRGWKQVACPRCGKGWLVDPKAEKPECSSCGTSLLGVLVDGGVAEGQHAGDCWWYAMHICTCGLIHRDHEHQDHAEHEANLRAMQQALENLKVLMPAYHRVMGLLRRTKMEHGTCDPPERNACTACMAQRELDALLEQYRGAPVAAQSAGETAQQDAVREASALMDILILVENASRGQLLTLDMHQIHDAERLEVLMQAMEAACARVRPMMEDIADIVDDEDIRRRDAMRINLLSAQIVGTAAAAIALMRTTGAPLPDVRIASWDGDKGTGPIEALKEHLDGN